MASARAFRHQCFTLLVALAVAVVVLAFFSMVAHSSSKFRLPETSQRSAVFTATAQVNEIVDQRLKVISEEFQKASQTQMREQKQMVTEVVKAELEKAREIVSEQITKSVTDVLDRKLVFAIGMIEKGSDLVDEKFKSALEQALAKVAGGHDLRASPGQVENPERRMFSVATSQTQAEKTFAYTESAELRKRRTVDAEFKIAFEQWESSIQRCTWHMNNVGAWVANPGIELPDLIAQQNKEACNKCQCSFINEYLLPANCDIEIPERSLALKWIPKSATVLEVGARYGSVSCVISAILEHSGRLVSVEADETVWEVLERNRANLRCNFHIAKGLLAKQAGRIQKNAYGTIAQSGDAIEGDAGVVVPHFSVDELRQQYDTAFDVAVFDCEGCFSGVLKDFPELKQQLKLLIVESHGDDEHQMMMELVRDAGWQIHERSLNLWVLVNAGDVAMRKGPRTTKIRWTLQRKCPQDCTQVCRQEDMSCDDGAFQSLAGLLEAKLAFKAAGHQCHEFVEKQVQDPLWNGPGAIVDTCEYSSNPGPHGDSSCNIVSYCGWGQGKFRLCPCF